MEFLTGFSTPHPFKLPTVLARSGGVLFLLAQNKQDTLNFTVASFELLI